MVQETFIKLLKSGAWLQTQDERAFLARVAWRIAVNRRPRPQPASEPEEIPAGTPETAVIAAEETKRMHALIDALPEKLRRLLILHALKDLSTAEVAAILEQPEGTIRRRIAEARNLLKENWRRMNSNAG